MSFCIGDEIMQLLGDNFLLWLIILLDQHLFTIDCIRGSAEDGLCWRQRLLGIVVYVLGSATL